MSYDWILEQRTQKRNKTWLDWDPIGGPHHRLEVAHLLSHFEAGWIVVHVEESYLMGDLPYRKWLIVTLENDDVQITQQRRFRTLVR